LVIGGAITGGIFGSDILKFAYYLPGIPYLGS
jgi:hypothetical protein